MWGVISKIFGSGKVIDGAIKSIDAMVFTDQEKSEMKKELVKQYEPFKLAQRYLALIFSLSYIFSFILAITIEMFGGDSKPITAIVESYNLDIIVLTVVAFYFSGGVVDSIRSKMNTHPVQK